LLGIHESLLLTPETMQLRKSHPLILSGYRQGLVIRLRIFQKPNNSSSSSPLRLRTVTSDSALTKTIAASIPTSASTGKPNTQSLSLPRASSPVLVEHFSSHNTAPVDATTKEKCPHHRRRASQNSTTDLEAPNVIVPLNRLKSTSPASSVLSAAGFTIDEGMELPLDPFSPMNLTLEDAHTDVPYYYEHFYEKEHFNFVGM
jgi:hypothetical protein